MARVLLTTFGTYGDLNPFVAVGLALKRRGHDAAIATAEGYRADVERAGLGFFPVRPDMDKSDHALFARAMDPVRGFEVIVREMLMPKLRDSYADLERAAEGRDLLVSHVLTFAAPIVAEKKGLKWLSTSLQPMSFVSAYDPPVLAPAPWLAALRPLGPGFHRFLFSTLKRLSRSWADEARALRRGLGLSGDADPLFEGQYSPYGTLALYPSLFGAPQPDWPERVRLCGFPFLDADLGGKGLDPRLDEFLNEGPPCAAFTLGTAAVMIAGGFYERAVEAAAEARVRAVLLAGPAAESLPAADGVFVAASAPYHALFPRCAAVVHSGGIGTTGQALRSGAPQLVVPHAHDQFDNAARVQRLGVGASSSAKRLPDDLVRILGDEELKKKAAHVGTLVRAENGAEAACAAIEVVLALKPGDRPPGR